MQQIVHRVPKKLLRKKRCKLSVKEIRGMKREANQEPIILKCHHIPEQQPIWSTKEYQYFICQFITRHINALYRDISDRSYSHIGQKFLFREKQMIASNHSLDMPLLDKHGVTVDIYTSSVSGLLQRLTGDSRTE